MIWSMHRCSFNSGFTNSGGIELPGTPCILKWKLFNYVNVILQNINEVIHIKNFFKWAAKIKLTANSEFSSVLDPKGYVAYHLFKSTLSLSKPDSLQVGESPMSHSESLQRQPHHKSANKKFAVIDTTSTTVWWQRLNPEKRNKYSQIISTYPHALLVQTSIEKYLEVSRWISWFYCISKKLMRNCLITSSTKGNKHKYFLLT